MSTVMERVMRERGDLNCMHEPFMYDYYLNQAHREMPYFQPKPGHPVRYTDVRDMILASASTTPVFFKDMSYYHVPYLEADAEFSRRLSHGFLIRQPEASIASYYSLDNDVSLTEIGYEAQWQHYTHLIECGLQPVVMQAEEIRRDPQQVIKRWWQQIGLEFTERAFQWNSDYPDDWNQVQGWHAASIASDGIEPLRDDESAIADRRFAAAVQAAPHLAGYLEHHQPFYEKLLAVALLS